MACFHTTEAGKGLVFESGAGPSHIRNEELLQLVNDRTGYNPIFVKLQTKTWSKY